MSRDRAAGPRPFYGRIIQQTDALPISTNGVSGLRGDPAVLYEFSVNRVSWFTISGKLRRFLI
jgi:hypothetical protein